MSVLPSPGSQHPLQALGYLANRDSSHSMLTRPLSPSADSARSPAQVPADGIFAHAITPMVNQGIKGPSKVPDPPVKGLAPSLPQQQRSWAAQELASPTSLTSPNVKRQSKLKPYRRYKNKKVVLKLPYAMMNWNGKDENVECAGKLSGGTEGTEEHPLGRPTNRASKIAAAHEKDMEEPSRFAQQAGRPGRQLSSLKRMVEMH